MEIIRHRPLQGTKNIKGFSEELFEESFVYKDNEYPSVSIIIPTYNCATSIGPTIESLLEQDYPNYDIIVIDASSTDRTLEVIKSYHHSTIHLYSVSGYYRYEMLNKGISIATGNYLNFLFPGDFYIHKNALKYMMGMALHYELPAMVFCGCLLRDGRSEVKVLYRHLSLSLLKQGKQPTSLQSCWFRKEVFNEVGKFNTSYKQRGGYEFMCRFALRGGFRTVSTHHVLTDYDLHLITRKMIMEHFRETGKTIYRYFGLGSLILWFFRQNDLTRYFIVFLRSLRTAFMGLSRD